MSENICEKREDTCEKWEDTCEKRDDVCKPNQILVYSSFVFLTNVIVGIYFGYYVYAFLFFLLCCISIIFHSNPCNTNLLVDKIAICLVVFYGGYVFYNKCTKTDCFHGENVGRNALLAFIIMMTFFTTVYLYYYGYTCKKYCFAEDTNVANRYHAFMHMVGSFGHNLIIFM